MASGSSRNNMFGIYRILYNLPRKCNKKTTIIWFRSLFCTEYIFVQKAVQWGEGGLCPDKRFTMRRPITESRTSKVSEFRQYLHTVTYISLPDPKHPGFFFAGQEKNRLQISIANYGRKPHSVSTYYRTIVQCNRIAISTVDITMEMYKRNYDFMWKTHKFPFLHINDIMIDHILPTYQNFTISAISEFTNLEVAGTFYR